MPTVTRWFIRSGLLSLLAALTLRTIDGLAVPSTVSLIAPARPTTLHLLVVGWLTQLIFGVSYWMFPRHPTHPPRGSESIAWASLILLNLGLVLRLVGEPMAASTLTRTLLVTSSLAHAAAALLFTVVIWPRVRGR